MRRQKLSAVLSIGITLIMSASSQAAVPIDSGVVSEPLVISATRLETPERELASSVTVVTRKEIEASQKTTVFDVLRTQPALNVVNTGGAGGTTNVFIRGVDSGKTLVMIDGIATSDPSSTDRSFDLGNMSVDNIDRIEIIRGPQSTLYGSDAMGGVINIITRKGQGRPHVSALYEGGTYKTGREQAGVSGGTESVNYSVEASRRDSAGFSATDKRLGNSETDRNGNTSVSGRVGYLPTKNSSIDVTSRYNTAHTNLDASGGDDPNYVTDVRELFLRGQGKLALADGKWNQTAGVSFTHHDRNFDNPVDTLHPTDSLEASYKSSLMKEDWQHDVRLHPSNTATLGAELQQETAQFNSVSNSSFGPFVSDFARTSAYTNGFFLQDQVKAGDSFFATLGGRLDNHSRFGSVGTYRATAAYWILPVATKVKATYGTGFKAPSLYQLFSIYGDPKLNPEKSTGWDAGLEQEFLGGRGTFGATFFRNDFRQLIDFDSTLLGGNGQYVNRSKATSHGLEFTARCRPVNGLMLSANHTITNAKDETTGERLVRRPRNQSGASADYDYSSKGNVHIDGVFVGRRMDVNFPPPNVKLGSYTLLNLGTSYEVVSHVRIFGRLENALNKKYEEVLGFGTAGRTVVLGVKASF